MDSSNPPVPPHPSVLSARLSVPRKEFLHGVFTTAVEGGIDYWSAVREYHWASALGAPNEPTDDLDGFYAEITPTESDKVWGVFADANKDAGPLRIDLEVVDRGAKLLLLYIIGGIDSDGQMLDITRWEPDGDKSYRWQYVASYATLGKEGDYDAAVADMVVQFGLFGKLVFA